MASSDTRLSVHETLKSAAAAALLAWVTQTVWGWLGEPGHSSAQNVGLGVYLACSLLLGLINLSQGPAHRRIYAWEWIAPAVFLPFFMPWGQGLSFAALASRVVVALLP